MYGIASMGQYNYVMYSSAQTFGGAEAACRTLVNGSLASIGSDAEWCVAGAACRGRGAATFSHMPKECDMRHILACNGSIT